MTVNTLPEGRHFAVTWAIPWRPGGMTNACLHRSRAFVREGGATVEILTFDSHRNYAVVRMQLALERKLVRGMRIRNLWAELRAMSDEELGQADESASRPCDSPEKLSWRARFTSPRAERLVKRRYSADGKKLLQEDYFRRDGSLVVSDRRDTKKEGVLGGRTVSLFSREGQLLRSWSHIHQLYHFWLDRVFGTAQCYVIRDSFRTEAFLWQYRRPNVLLMHFMHSSHLPPNATSALSEVAPRHFPALQHLDDYDAVVFLSRGQLEDVDQLVGPGRNRYVVPNSRTVPASRPSSHRRSRAGGVVLTTLAAAKQVDQAIRAIADVRQRGYGDVTLDIYGVGPQREELDALVRDLRLQAWVRLKGYSWNGARHFRRASFSLLTSASEGFSLALVESMLSGCIPIAYDVRYGPAEVITNGIDGFLVRSGDIAGVGDAIAQVMEMPTDQLDRMRQAAYDRATAFSDHVIVRRWIDVINEAAGARTVLQSLSLTNVRGGMSAGGHGLRFAIAFGADRSLTAPQAFLVFRDVKRRIYLRIPGTLEHVAEREPYRLYVEVSARRVTWLPVGARLELFVELRDAHGSDLAPLPCSGEMAAPQWRVDRSDIRFSTAPGEQLVLTRVA